MAPVGRKQRETSASIFTDGDCDGFVGEDDCDDYNEQIGSVANDQDCDGVETSLDCDDNNPLLAAVENSHVCFLGECRNFKKR